MKGKKTSRRLMGSIIAIFLLIVCLVCLLFTLNNNKAEKKADLDNMGGMKITLQASIPDILRSMKYADEDTVFEKAIVATDSITNHGRNDIDYLSTFVEQYRANESGTGRKADFSVLFRDYIIPDNTPDDEVAKYLKREVDNRVNTSVTTVLRQRIDAFGVVSPNIRVLKDKTGQILLELPGVKDQKRMLDLVQKSGKLEFYETYMTQTPNVVNSLNSLTERQRQSGDFDGKGLGDYLSIVDSNGGIIGYALDKDVYMVDSMLKWPDIEREHLLDRDLRLYWSNKPGDNGAYALYALRARNGNAALYGDVVKSARAGYDHFIGNYISMDMNSEGTKIWSRVTANNIGYPIAVVLDEKVYSAPNVNDRIDGGSSQISGTFTDTEAQDLANLLKSGQMDFKIEVINSMVVEPSSGE